MKPVSTAWATPSSSMSTVLAWPPVRASTSKIVRSWSVRRRCAATRPDTPVPTMATFTVMGSVLMPRADGAVTRVTGFVVPSGCEQLLEVGGVADAVVLVAVVHQHVDLLHPRRELVEPGNPGA